MAISKKPLLFSCVIQFRVIQIQTLIQGVFIRQTKHIRFLFAIALLVAIVPFSAVRNTYYAVATTGGVPTKFTLQDIPTSNPFGFPTSSFGPRIMQFAAKVVF
ncbi:MAG TPA: hypothetical protein VNN25_20475 [Thermoanaerobaculia bacterium]|nr:hypothetical protein [Thermoanaerobaculia bacterium]